MRRPSTRRAATLAVLLLAATASAQAPCPGANVWKQQGDETAGARSDFKLGPKELQAGLAQLALHEAVVRDALASTTGRTLTLSRALGLGFTDELPGRPVGAEVTAFASWQRCEAPAALAPPELHLVTNRLRSLVHETQLSFGGQRAFLLAWELGPELGGQLFDVPAGGSGSTRILERALLLTPGGRLPFVPVTRGQVLVQFRTELQRAREDSLAAAKKGAHLRPKAEQEAQQQRRLAEIERSFQGDARESRRRRYLQDWRSDEQALEESLARVAALYEEKLARLGAVAAASSPEALGAPATLHHSDASAMSVTARWDFTAPKRDGHRCTDRCRHGQALVTVDPAFFAARAPAIAPRLLVVRVAWPELAGKEAWNAQNEALAQALLGQVDVGRLAATLRR